MPRIFLSEYVHSYATYTFGYAVYAERMENESLDAIWNQGFLSYTGDRRAEVKHIYYMTRSVRVDLSSFQLNSENRRIKKKFDTMPFTVTEYPAAHCIDNEAMIDFCLANFKASHAMSRARLKRVFECEPEATIVEYKDSDGIIRAYIVEIKGEEASHHYYDFYDQSLADRSFGMWLMLDRTEHMKASGQKYYYLGTLYGENSLYKTNIMPIEFWTGSVWSADLEALKNLARSDAKRVDDTPDLFKDGIDL